MEILSNAYHFWVWEQIDFGASICSKFISWLKLKTQNQQLKNDLWFCDKCYISTYFHMKLKIVSWGVQEEKSVFIKGQMT